MSTPPATSPALDPRCFSVVLPAYNEEECIHEAVQQCVDFLPTCFATWEVLVVDDGSKDRTAAIVEELSAEHPGVRLIKHEVNQGYGRAIATGFDAAQGDLIFFTDSDCQFDVRELAHSLPLLEDADALFGFRVYRYDSVLRCLLSWTYNQIVRVLFLVKVRDVDCAFKIFKRPVIDRLELETTDFFIDTELVARTARLGFKSVEQGVRHYPRKAGKTTVRASHIPLTLWTVARMWWRLRFGKSAGRGKS